MYESSLSAQGRIPVKEISRVVRGAILGPCCYSLDTAYFTLWVYNAAAVSMSPVKLDAEKYHELKQTKKGGKLLYQLPPS